MAVLQDLCGPKMRLGPLPCDPLECHLGEEFTLVSASATGNPRELTCSYRDLPNDLKPGEAMLFADGTVAMTVAGTTPGRARLKVTLPGRLRSRQGLNLPGSQLAVESLTDKDLHDLDWTERHAGDVEFVGLSFVRSADDVARLRRELRSRGCTARIVVKIEKPEAVRHLEEIVDTTDCVMVARGDLGVEMDAQWVLLVGVAAAVVLAVGDDQQRLLAVPALRRLFDGEVSGVVEGRPAAGRNVHEGADYLIARRGEVPNQLRPVIECDQEKVVIWVRRLYELAQRIRGPVDPLVH